MPSEDQAQEALVERLAAEGIRDARILQVLRGLPRGPFLPLAVRAFAYDDLALPIGFRQTISQPFVVAAMTEELELRDGDRVLEVGTGSGYQTAVLARLLPGSTIRSIELLPELHVRAGETLAALGVGNVELRLGDGRWGWADEAPFDAVLVAAAAPVVPVALLAQLAPGGRLVMPVGPESSQVIERWRKDAAGGLSREELMAVRFVPLVAPAP